MTGDIGAAADIATGALVGRAFEPRAGEAQGEGHGNLCLNCGTRLIGDHCHACGQSGHVHRSLGAIGHEIAHGVFHFEGKIWRTLPLLVLHPGTLTRRYVHGERARFVSPLALFLFTVFLMFATIGTVGGEIGDDIGERSSPATRAQITAQVTQAQAELAKTQAERAAAVKAGKPVGDLDTQAYALRATIRALDAASGGKDGARDFTFTDLKTGWPRLDHGIAKANENPRLMIYKLQSSAYKYS